MNTINSKQKGVTLIELMMVLGIIGLIAIGILAYFKSTSESANVTRETQNLGALSSGIAKMFAAQGNYTGLNNTVVKASNVLPDSMDGGAGTAIRNAWAANGVTVAAQTINSPDDAFDITYTMVPPESCVDLVSATIGSFNAASVNGTAVTNVADIAVNCNLADNTIIWTL